MDHFTYRNAELHAEDVPVRTIADAVGTPAYVYSAATLTRHYRVFTEAFAATPHKVCFAVKANGNLAVLNRLARLGSGADVVSGGEIRRALTAGMQPQDIVFSGVGKTREEMAFALQQGIFQFNVESAPELDALSAVAAAAGREAAIAFRVNPDVDPGTHAKIATGQRDTKFGVAMEDTPALYARAAALPGIRVQGVSVHIGSQLTSTAPFEAAYRRVAALVQELRAAGHTITTLDLGGGLGVPYRDESPPLPDEYAARTLEAVGNLGCTLIFEPGRMIAANAGILVASVLYIKDTAHRRFVILDAGMNDLARPALYDAYHAIVPVAEPTVGTDTALADVVGPVCETGDSFGHERPLPATLAAGDRVAIRSAGAYGAVMANTYNARPLPPEMLVDGDRFHIVRPRQTVEEMLAGEQMAE